MVHSLWQGGGPVARNSPPDVTELLPAFWIGEFPRVEDIGWLRAAHAVSFVFSLQDDEDLAVKGLDARELELAYATHGVQFRRVAVPDYEPDRLSEKLDDLLLEIQEALEGGHCLYLHCNAGMNRAPTVAIAYLHAYRGYELDEARDFVKARRTCAPYMQLLHAHFGAGKRS